MPHVTFTREGGVGLITLNRPPVNAYHLDFVRDLGAAIDEARADGSVRAVLVQSALEKFFSAGADLQFFRESTLDARNLFIAVAHETLRRMERTPKVFIAVINGHCLGGGLEIALACDLRFAAAGAGNLGQPEINLGLLPGNGGTQRLPRLVGRSRALDLMITGRSVSAEEALQIGLVDRVFPKEDLAAKAMEYAQKVAEGPSFASGLIKRAVQEGMEAGLDAGLALEREAMARAFASEDATEGVAAFTEKRKPSFKGR
ncbi:MAG: enoyl-CoA hydratase/isomerase family protein [Armatimonadetes bacterium]|nr:enoyl-CoA hydratase/isomerase family protein [Armatimonadota bacterium]